MFSFMFMPSVYKFPIYVYLLLTLLCFCCSQPFCHDHEKSSLLQFKQSFTIEKFASGNPSAYPKVNSWTHEGGTTHDCCFWDGVECDKDTGHVISLDLSSSFLHGSLDSNSSLFSLLHLWRLNLADNHFNYSQIPTSIKQLSMLTYLNLSDSFFSGQIPSEVSELSKLTSLDLAYNIDPLSEEKLLELKRPNFESLILNLTSLEQLRLSYVDISSTVPVSLVNASSLTSLLLNDCGLKGEFPIGIFQLPNLQILSVRFNEDLTGSLPPFKQWSSLKELWLSGTSSFGHLPSPIEKLASLTVLDASSCNISGEIPTSIGKLNQLTYLRLSGNSLRGEIPTSIGKLNQLTYLRLSGNFLTGEIPTSIGKLNQLTYLRLSGNSLTGEIPTSIGKLNQLTYLRLSGNSLRGEIPTSIGKLNQLTFLDLSTNSLIGEIPTSIGKLNQLTFLDLSTNSLIGEVAPTICNLSSLAMLGLFHNKLSGNLPQCLGYFSKSLSLLDLSGNLFSGNIPMFTEVKQFTFIDLSNNQLQGKLPRSLVNCSALKYLNLRNNELNDVFPYWLGTLPKLEILVLRSNQFHGVIADSKQKNFGLFPNLQIIDLSCNNFIGKLPSNYMKSWKAMKNSSHMEPKGIQYMMEIDSNHDDKIFFELNLTIKGVDRNYQRIQNTIAIINLSNNKFNGEIPKIIGKLEGLFALDLSSNNLTGGIPSSLGNLLRLESLDLSQNELSGHIPQELTQLTFLQYFNVSHNHLTGPIPQAHQLTTFESSSYEVNWGLCGIPLPNKCGNSEALDPPLPSYEEQQEESSSFFQFGWKVVAVGYGCGFVVGLFIGRIVIARYPNWFAMTFGIRAFQVRRKPRMRPRN